MAEMTELVAYIARALSEQPEAVEVSEFTRGKQKMVRLRVADQDMGRVIGRDGRVANAIRAIMKASPDGEHWGLEIAD